VANYLVDTAAYARAVVASCTSPETRDLGSSDAGELWARAKRYRLLSEILFTPSVIQAVQACALELETEAAWIEMGDSRPSHWVVP
jgi:hypothetical protein